MYANPVETPRLEVPIPSGTEGGRCVSQEVEKRAHSRSDMAVSRVVQAKPRVRRRPLRQHLPESPVGDCVRRHPPRDVGEAAAIQSGGHIGGLRTPEHLRKSIEQGASTTALLAGRRWWTGFPAGTSTTVRRPRWSTSAAWDHSKAWQDTLSIRRMPSVSGRWRRGCRQRCYNPEGTVGTERPGGFRMRGGLAPIRPFPLPEVGTVRPCG